MKTNIPNSKPHFSTPWIPVEINGPANILILSDIHFPYHSPVALEAALGYARSMKAEMTHILLNGDTIDCFAESFWEKDWRKRDFPGELAMTRDFIAGLRAEFPNVKLIYKEGNHEQRHERYMIVKAPALLGVPEFELGSLLGLLPGELVRDMRPIRLGDLNVVHGHEWKFGISSPVNIARGLYLRAKVFALCGHFHRGSYHSERTLEGKNIATWSTGCLCDLRPEYSPINSWDNGCAYVRVAKNGSFEVQNKYISETGKLY